MHISVKLLCRNPQSVENIYAIRGIEKGTILKKRAANTFKVFR